MDHLATGEVGDSVPLTQTLSSAAAQTLDELKNDGNNTDNGVIYVTNADHTVAIDVDTRKQLWRTPVEWDPATPRVVCCGVSNKGPAIC